MPDEADRTDATPAALSGARSSTAPIPPPPTVAAGWYVDGAQPDALRYWDGTTWLDEWAPRPPTAAEPGAGAPAPVAPPAAAQAATGAGQRAAGWYPDPDTDGYKRYFDGTAWTKRTVLDTPAGTTPKLPVRPPSAAISRSRTSGLAVAAFVCAILGIWFASIPLGYTARREIDGSRGTMEGRGYATAAIVLGWIGVGLTVIVIVLLVSAAGDAYKANSYDARRGRCHAERSTAQPGRCVSRTRVITALVTWSHGSECRSTKRCS